MADHEDDSEPTNHQTNKPEHIEVYTEDGHFVADEIARTLTTDLKNASRRRNRIGFAMKDLIK